MKMRVYNYGADQFLVALRIHHGKKMAMEEKDDFRSTNLV